MKGIVVAKAGGAENLKYEDVPAPKLNDGQVLIEVYATALNGADLLQRAGNYPPPPGNIALCNRRIKGISNVRMIEVTYNVHMLLETACSSSKSGCRLMLTQSECSCMLVN